MLQFAMSAAVSVAAEKMGGEFFHPIGRTSRSTTNGFEPSLTGKTTPSRGMSFNMVEAVTDV